jgi:hypothetical protein
MGLIGENCTQCVAAAEAEDGGGLVGSWWRGWARVSNLIQMVDRIIQYLRFRRAMILVT